MTFFKSNTVSKLGTASLVMTVLALAALACPELALAQNADWVKPATGILEVLEGGLVQIGAACLGLGIIAYGIYQVISGQADFKKLGMMIMGAIIVMFGPEIIRALLGVS